MEYLNNYIIGEILIQNNNINKKQRIINSLENWKREHLHDWDWENIISENNEEEIKLCEIYIESEKINFNYFYCFNKCGKYKIKYNFKVALKSINFLFTGCDCITYLDFSNFKIEKITSLSHLFYGCKSLESLNINNLNTQNIIDLGYLYSNCHSLKSMDLSNFVTINTLNMRGLFYECENLESINIRNFDTRNVKYMDYMFYRNN